MITTVPANFLDIEEVKAHLNKTDDLDDTELASFTSAAEQMIVRRKGQMAPVTAVEDLDGGNGMLLLAHRPVLSVTTVAALPNLTAVPEADEAAGVAGWSVRNPEGVLAHTREFPRRVRVTYQAGRDPIPADYMKAGHELAAHLWRHSQLNAGGGRPGIGEPDEVLMPGAAYALPFRVRELLGLGLHMTDRPLVG